MQSQEERIVSSGQPSLQANIVANFLGRISGLLLGILFTPLYIHFLGIEGYGLVAFYLMLQGSISFLEMGLSRACNRELARYSGYAATNVRSMRNTLRTLEVTYWVVAAFIGSGIMLLAPWLSHKWLSSASYAPESIQQVVTLIGWVIALRWPIGLYQGALMGMQHQVRMNMAQIGLSLLTGFGAVFALWQINSSIEVFFYWQLIAASVGVIFFCALSWSVMPQEKRKARFSLKRLQEIYRFATGVGVNAILGTTLRQADKIILSGLLPLKQFAYYALATLVAQTITMAADAIANAVFPRLSQMVGAEARQQDISALYHKACQLIALLIMPLALSLSFFAEEALFVYSGDQEIANNTAMIMSILVIAKMLHASVIMPYMMQMAYGWLGLSIKINIVSVIWFIPALILLANKYGAVGAAIAWLAVTIGYVFVGAPLMHRRLLVGQSWQWLSLSVLKPTAVVSVFLILTWQISLAETRWLLGFELLAIGVGALVMALLVTSPARSIISRIIKTRVR